MGGLISYAFLFPAVLFLALGCATAVWLLRHGARWPLAASLAIALAFAALLAA